MVTINERLFSGRIKPIVVCSLLDLTQSQPICWTWYPNPIPSHRQKYSQWRYDSSNRVYSRSILVKTELGQHLWAAKPPQYNRQYV